VNTQITQTSSQDGIWSQGASSQQQEEKVEEDDSESEGEDEQVDELPDIPEEYEAVLIRKEFKPPPKRKRDRPPKTLGEKWHRPVGVSVTDQSVNFDLTNERITAYKKLEHCIFKDPKTNRIYNVSIIAFDRAKGVIAYRRSLDDLPPDENDDKP
jgi:hypothetical protein